MPSEAYLQEKIKAMEKVKCGREGCNNEMQKWERFCQPCEESLEELKEDFISICNDNKEFRYGVHKRPMLPQEKDYWEGSGWVFTNAGEKKARELFKEMFPAWACYPEDSGLNYD